MRKLVLLSVILLASGILFFGLSQGLATFTSNPVSMAFHFTAFALLISSPLVMLLNLILSILPGSKLKLEQCNH